jgi:hypothetical protein
LPQPGPLPLITIAGKADLWRMLPLLPVSDEQ